MRFLLKSIRSILCKVKKDDFIKKTRSFFYVKEKKKDTNLPIQNPKFEG